MARHTWTLSVAILLVFITLMLGISPQTNADDSYTKVYNTDSPDDIGGTGLDNITLLEIICSSRPYCAGFNNRGFLKYDTLGQYTSKGTTLYVKNPAPTPQPMSPFNVWPQPQEWSAGNINLTVVKSSNFFQATGFVSPLLKEAFLRYYSIIFAVVGSVDDSKSEYSFSSDSRSLTGATLSGCDVEVLTSNEILQLGFDESYNLYIPSASSGNVRANLTANTVFGAFRGLETFSQLITYTWDNEFFINFTPINITDYPRYKHRGLLVDTSRHYLPKSTILEIIEAMSATKLNTLHWHLVDDPSFPFVSLTYPLLSEMGAYNNQRAIYTHADVQEVIHFALLRGIRVMPEFDMPAHTGSWFKGYPSLQGNGTCGFDPTLPSTYEFIENFLAEIVKLFPENYIHLGGDELASYCWQTAPIQEWMKENNISSFGQLEAYFENKVLTIANNLGARTMVWQDVFNNGVRPVPGTVIVPWHLYDNTTMGLIAAAGYQICSSKEWYLNRPYLVYTWADLYIRELNDGQVPQHLDYLIIGGETSIWGEWVDENNIIPTVFPRGAAAAEVLWSSAAYPKVPNLAANRLHQWKCRMNRRGINVEPVSVIYGPSFCDPL